MRNIMIGIVIGALLAVGGTAFAEDVQSWIGKTIEGQFPISVDGERVSQPGLVIEGTSYLPVRAAGELFGYDVSFVDSEVILNKNELAEGEEEVGLLKSYENLTDQELLKEYEKWQNSLSILPDHLDNNAREITNKQIQEIERIMQDRGIDPNDEPDLSESEKQQLDMFGTIFESIEAIDGQIRAERPHLDMHKSRLYGVDDEELKSELEEKIAEHESRIEFLEELKVELRSGTTQ